MTEVTGQVEAAAAAPTATTGRAAPSRSRAPFRIGLLVVLAAAIATAAYLVMREPADSDEFRPQVEALFMRLNQGPEEAARLYEEETSPQFRQLLISEKFEDLTDRMVSTLGKFVEIVKVVEVDRAASVAGMTARVELELAFEKADTTGEVSFLRGSDARWKLLGFNVKIPQELQGKAAQVERELERNRAPEEVTELVNQILQALRDGKVAEVRDAASPVFQQAHTVETFTALLESHRAALGDFVAVLATISSAQNPDKDRAVVRSYLQYENGKTEGTFHFMRIDGVWRLFGYKVVVPEPSLPPR